MAIPQPGEIWEVNRFVRIPFIFSIQDQQSLYSASAQSFLLGNSPRRYVMIVKEPEIFAEIEEEWLIVSVMLLSPEVDLISDIDLLIPAQVSGLDQDLLAETWHIIPALVCNLLRSVAQRLPHQIYDYLLTVSNSHHGVVSQLPTITKIQGLWLKNNRLYSANHSKIQDFHQAEQAWSDVLTVPVAAYHTYLKGIKFTNALLNEALQLEQDLQADMSD